MTTNANAPPAGELTGQRVIARLLRGVVSGLIPQLPDAAVNAVVAETTARLFDLVKNPEKAQELLNADRGEDGLTDAERAAGFTAAGVLGDDDMPDEVKGNLVDRRVPGDYTPPDTGRDTHADVALNTEQQLASDRARQEKNVGADGGRVIPLDPADGGRIIEADPADGGSVQSEEGQ